MLRLLLLLAALTACLPSVDDDDSAGGGDDDDSSVVPVDDDDSGDDDDSADDDDSGDDDDSSVVAVDDDDSAATGDDDDDDDSATSADDDDSAATGDDDDDSATTADDDDSAATADDDDSAVGDDDDSAPSGVERALFDWDPSHALDPIARSAAFAYASAQGFDRIYQEAESLVLDHPGEVPGYLADAQAAGLEVSLLFGYAPWALAANHGTAVALAELAVSAAGPHSPALHFDVEPHGLPEWSTDQAALVEDYLSLLEQLSAVTSAAGLVLEADMPFWYDTLQSTWDGPSRPLSELVLDRVDRALIMDYRDHAAPPNGMLDLAESELLYAAAMGRSVVVAVETNCITPTHITFCEEGRAAMEAELTAFELAQPGGAALVGLAVHDRDGLEGLGP